MMMNNPQLKTLFHIVLILIFFELILYFSFVYDKYDRLLLEICIIIQIILLSVYTISNKTIQKNVATLCHMAFAISVVIIPIICKNKLILMLYILTLSLTIFVRNYYGECLFNSLDNCSSDRWTPRGLNADLIFIIFILITIIKICILL